MVAALVRSLRPTQWAKNLFVLAPLVFGHALFDRELLGRGLAAFAAFCLAASAIYLFNDLRDRERDRLHPLKRHRPIASGALPVGLATTASLTAAAAALGIAYALGPLCLLVIAIYLVLNGLYTLHLKQVVILDVMIISLGFVLRVLAGGAAIGVAVSHWLLLCTIFLALFLGFSKRRHEISLLAERAADQRQVLSQYSLPFLDQMINVVTASSVVAYALWAVAPETTARYGGPYLIYTIPLVLFGVFRYLYLVYQRRDERNPTEALMKDWPFLTNLLLWGVTVTAIVYLT
ncbi:MAG: decaprenyl-phosphate phosphoribosyltransferase [Acidobacteriota bacterium]